MAIQTYKQEYLDARVVSWDPDLTESDVTGHNGYFFVLVDHYPTDRNTPGRHLQFEYGTVSLHHRSADAAMEWYSSTRAKYPAMDWTKSNPRIVKALCVFDAHKHGVFVEAL